MSSKSAEAKTEMSTEYDDSPCTDEEMELLAWESGKLAGWEEMDEYDYYLDACLKAALDVA